MEVEDTAAGEMICIPVRIRYKDGRRRGVSGAHERALGTLSRPAAMLVLAERDNTEVAKVVADGRGQALRRPNTKRQALSKRGNARTIYQRCSKPVVECK